MNYFVYTPPISSRGFYRDYPDVTQPGEPGSPGEERGGRRLYRKGERPRPDAPFIYFGRTQRSNPFPLGGDRARRSPDPGARIIMARRVNTHESHFSAKTRTNNAKQSPLHSVRRKAPARLLHTQLTIQITGNAEYLHSWRDIKPFQHVLGCPSQPEPFEAFRPLDADKDESAIA